METVALKRRKNKVWAQEQDDDQNNTNDDFETDQRFYAKRKVLKTWGFYNERFKQGWEQYVASPEGTQIGALYLGTMIFLEIMCRYIARKHSKNEDEAEQPEKDKNSGMRVTDKGANNASDYMFRKRKGGRNLSGEGSAVEKYNLRIKQRIEFDRKMEMRAKEQAADPYDDLDDYSPERLKTTRNTRALTKKLNHKY